MPEFTSFDRRTALRLAVGLSCSAIASSTSAQPAVVLGRVEGHPEGAKAGVDVLAGGGNAVDAVVAAALVAAVTAPQMCGPGGYGGHAVIAWPDGRVTGIDFNSAAPAAATPDMFAPDAAGRVPDRANAVGWKASGVPGILAGLQFALDRYGTRRFPQVVGPAIRFARDGFVLPAGVANSIRSARAQLAKDPASAALLLPGGEPPRPGSTLRNPDLAKMLEALAKHGSVEPFYRGSIAARIAMAFAAHGGLVTEADLANYQAREVEPLSFGWRGATVRTPPPTAGGLSVLQALHVLKALRWHEWEARDPRLLRARVEALRLAWDDRLRFLGDPRHADVPIRRLLSAEHAAALAAKVERALEIGKPVATTTDGRPAGGTIHLSACDGRGMMAALTLTHGGGFGAQVTVPGLGLTLGHGMSRFDPRPTHPNAPGPRKRPLHNMCPTVVLRDGRPVLAVGGRGGRKIPNAVFEVLAQYLARGATPAAAVAAPRVHTEGGLRVELEAAWPEEEAKRLAGVGYTVARAGHATVSAVWLEGGTVRGAIR